MNILLTNDDGYDSIGILLVKEKLLKFGNVVIVAPLNAMSAKSCSISINVPLNLKKIEENVYALNGTPADCVALGLSSLGIDFDLVVSGCNKGWNVSYDTLFSGTIGAASQALVCHKPAIAFSAEFNFDIVTKYFDEVFNYILINKLLSKEYILNVNFPLGEKVKSIELGKLYYRQDSHFFTKEKDGYYAYRNIEKNFQEYKGSDCYQVNNGIVSIVPLNKTLFSMDLYRKINNKLNKKK